MVYVTSDLHGFSLEKFIEFLDKAGFGEDDFLYILGDVIDRGPDGIRILRWIMQQPNAGLILGNHEAMMLNCKILFDDIERDSDSKLTIAEWLSVRTWTDNGGSPTIYALAELQRKEINDIIAYLSAAPLYKTLSVNGRDFVLVHSGLGNFRKDKKLSEYTPYELLWTRPGLITQYSDDFTVIFGHTPTACYGNKYMGRIVKSESFINIDVGVAMGQEPALLRLDDMKEIYYKDIINVT